MKRFLLFVVAFALIAVMGCDQDKNPASPSNATHVQAETALQNVDAASAKASVQKQNGSENQAAAAAIKVPDDYPTIQAAVDAAAPGAKIVVKAAGSPYNETVTVNHKNIHILAKGAVTLNGGFVVWGDSTVIEGFAINAASSTLNVGVRINHARGVKIHQNQINGGWRGIELFEASGCFLEKNVVTGAQANGIFFYNSHFNAVTKNSCTGNSQGMNMVFSDNNRVRSNDFSDNAWVGLEVSNESDQNRFEKNLCNRNGRDGIFHYSSSNNVFGPGNVANFNQYGMRFDGTNIIVKKNDFHCNTIADILDGGTGNTVINNSTGPLPNGCQ